MVGVIFYTKKPLGKGGHHLRLFWPSNAFSVVRVRDLTRSHEQCQETTKHKPPVRGIAKPSKWSFPSGGNTYKH